MYIFWHWPVAEFLGFHAIICRVCRVNATPIYSQLITWILCISASTQRHLEDCHLRTWQHLLQIVHASGGSGNPGNPRNSPTKKGNITMLRYRQVLSKRRSQICWPSWRCLGSGQSVAGGLWFDCFWGACFPAWNLGCSKVVTVKCGDTATPGSKSKKTEISKYHYIHDIVVIIQLSLSPACLLLGLNGLLQVSKLPPGDKGYPQKELQLYLATLMYLYQICWSKVTSLHFSSGE